MEDTENKHGVLVTISLIFSHYKDFYKLYIPDLNFTSCIFLNIHDIVVQYSTVYVVASVMN